MIRRGGRQQNYSFTATKMKKIVMLFLIFFTLLYSKEKQEKSTSNSAVIFFSELETELKSKKYDLEFFIGKYTIPTFLKKDLDVKINIKGDEKGLNYKYENKYFKNSSLNLYLSDYAQIRYMYKKSYKSLFDIFPLHDFENKENKNNKIEK